MEQPPTSQAAPVGDSGCRIQLTRGKFAIVDRADEELSMHHWTAQRSDGGRWYASRSRDGETILLHREVAARAGLAIDGLEVDHRDGNGLDCRRENIRPATPSQNSCNRKRRSDNKSGFKGVYWHSSIDKWVAEIAVSGRKQRLGCFVNKLDAAAAYAAAAVRLHGEFARL